MDLTRCMRPLAARRRMQLARQDPAAAQTRELLRLVGQARDTRFGREHDFSAIRDVAGFQARVPLRYFDDFWAQYWQAAWPLLDNLTWPGRIPFFARTSGTTTGRTKHIPITREIIRANERAGFDLVAHHLAARPASAPLAGRSFILGGSTALEEVAPGVHAGDVSGINTRLTPFWISRRIFPPPDLARIPTWDEKLDRLSRGALDLDVTMMSGMCNWVLFMLDRIRELRRARGEPDGPTLPRLQLLIHGGVAMDLYRERLQAHLAGSPVETRELYPTSEGFIAFADRGPGEGLRLMLDNRLFLEFVPLAEIDAPNPTRHWAATIETGIDYALVLSNCAGLWAYVLGDVVRFVDTRPPRLLILGRIAQKLNPFGEHLITAEIEEAVAAAAARHGVTPIEFTVGPVFPRVAGRVGHHVYLIETAAPVADEVTAPFAAHVDAVLRRINYDYDGHRDGDSAIEPPRIVWLPRGRFEGWLRARNKLGGQHKVPRVVPAPDRFAALCAELGAPLREAGRTDEDEDDDRRHGAA